LGARAYDPKLGLFLAPIKAVQELLGHATIEMTMRYSHLSPDVRKDAVSLLDRAPVGAQGGHKIENDR
jgi:integrase